MQQHKRLIEFGKRSTNDFIVRMQKEKIAANIQNTTKFMFDFDDSKINITYAALTINVCIQHYALIFIIIIMQINCYAI